MKALGPLAAWALSFASLSCALDRLEVRDGAASGGSGGAAVDGGACSTAGCVLYATSSTESLVYVIDTRAASVATTIVLDGTPRAVAFHPSGAKAYVASYGGNQVQVIDTKTHIPIRAVAVGEKPVALAVAPDGKRIYVANAGSGTISVVDASTDEVTSSVPVDGEPRSLAVTPDGKELWVGDGCGQDCARAMNLPSLASWSDMPAVGGASLAFTPDGMFAYAADTIGCDGRYQKIERATHAVGKSLLDNGKGPAHSVAITHDGALAIFGKGSCFGAHNVYVTSAADDGVLATLNAPSAAYALAVSPDDSALYVARNDGTSGYVTFINLTALSITENIPIGGGTMALALSP